MGRVRSLGSWALIIAGCLLATLFWPFTLAHGPTSVNEQHHVLGMDMHGWGLLLGPAPKLLVAAALWTLRGDLGARSTLTRSALAALCLALVGSAALDLAFGGISAPFEILVAAPVATVLAGWSSASLTVRGLLGALAGAWWAAIALSQMSDAAVLGQGGFRVFGVVAYVVVGLLWVTLGAVLLRGRAASGEEGDAARTLQSR